MRYRKPLTAQGRHLESRGRLVVASYPSPVSQVLVLNVYMPSGGQHSDASGSYCLLERCPSRSYGVRGVPILLCGDFNQDPLENSLVPIILFKRWGFPLTTGPEQGSAPYSYVSTYGKTHIDYVMVSPRLPVLSQQLLRTSAQLWFRSYLRTLGP